MVISVKSNIDVPESIEDSKYLVLSNDSVRQLNVCDNYSFYKGSNKDLLSLLNKCVSIIGKRTYKNRLLYPCIDENIINSFIIISYNFFHVSLPSFFVLYFYFFLDLFFKLFNGV